MAAISEINSASTESSSQKTGFSFSNALKFVQESFGALADSFADNASVISEKSKMEIRETYPRMPWNDVQASISGSAARDVASHIVQVF